MRGSHRSHSVDAEPRPLVRHEDELCEVRLSESETILLFDKPNNCISNGHEDAKAVKDRNEKYKALLDLVSGGGRSVNW